jgi:hypothetical protein
MEMCLFVVLFSGEGRINVAPTPSRSYDNVKKLLKAQNVSPPPHTHTHTHTHTHAHAHKHKHTNTHIVHL